MPTPLLNAIESGFDTRGQRGKGEKPNLEIPKTCSPALASMPGRTRGWNKSCVLSLQQYSTGRLQEDKASIFIDLLHTSPRSGRFVRDIQAKPYICNAGYKRDRNKGRARHIRRGVQSHRAPYFGVVWKIWVKGEGVIIGTKRMNSLRLWKQGKGRALLFAILGFECP